MTDHRSLPRISPSLVAKAILAVYWTRLGSLNALGMTRSAKFWKSWLDGPLCSADSLGRIVASIDAATLRQEIHHVYDRLKRNKALPDLRGGRAGRSRDQRQLSSLLREQGKQALVVLQDERRDTYQDAAGLGAQQPPQPGSYDSRSCRWWDFPDLLSWPEVKGTIRVMRSGGILDGEPQLTKEVTPQTTSWVWLTTLSVAQARTEQVVRLAHMRWDIENHGFNELLNGGHANHVYRHHSWAIECFLLLAFLAYNIFRAFFARNLKPEVRRGRTMEFWVRLIVAEISRPPSLLLSSRTTLTYASARHTLTLLLR